MGYIQNNLKYIKKNIPENIRLVAVSKYYSVEDIREAYDAGQRIFGESRMQELSVKQAQLPQDIDWHFIGHLQTNKVKSVLPYITTIHSVDSLRLLDEIDKQAGKIGRIIDCFLEVYISQDESKYGFTYDECRQFFEKDQSKQYKWVRIIGLMGIASNTDDEGQIHHEFRNLRLFFENIKSNYGNTSFTELSMGMSHDYKIAIEEKTTIIRVGSYIFNKHDN